MDQTNLNWHVGNMTPEEIWPSISKVSAYWLMYRLIIGQHSDTLLADMLVLMQADSLSAMSQHTAYTRPTDVNQHIDWSCKGLKFWF